jgi:hypothetical protein
VADVKHTMTNLRPDAESRTTPFDLSKLVWYITVILTALVLSFILGLYSGVKKNFIFDLSKSIFVVLHEVPTLVGIPEHFLQPARYEGEGVTVNNPVNHQGDLILLAGFFQDTNELRLIRRDGDLVARWPVRFSEIFPDSSHLSFPPATDWNIDIHGSLALPDGSVLFNFEFGGLAKLDRCGKVVWALPRQTHHAVERAEGGGFWVPSRRYFSEDSASPFPPFSTPLSEDTILKVSEDGAVLDEISVPTLFYENGLEGLLTAIGNKTETAFQHEIFHLNGVDELNSDIAGSFPMFEAGDLVLSIYGANLLLVVDPDTRRIKWWQIGPWLRQHSPRFKRGGMIIIFNNNLYGNLTGDSTDSRLPARTSNILEVDPTSGQTKTLYGNEIGQEMISVFRGKVRLTGDDGLFITEFEGGRVFEVNSSGTKTWEFINRYDADNVAEVTEGHIYPDDYFQVKDWSCLESVNALEGEE